MIKMQIIGHLGRDCTQNEVNGKNVLNFPVAHSEKFKDNQGNLVERTTWVNCAYWTDRTGIAPYLLKGQLIFAEGAPDVEAYSNKENQPAASLRMRVFNIQLLGGKSDNAGSGAPAAPASNTNANNGGSTFQDDAIDDLPF